MLDNSGGSDLSARTGMSCKKGKNALIFYYRFDHFNRTGLNVFSQKFESSLSTFSDSFVVYLCSCHVLLAEFHTSATLTGFHVFAFKFSEHFENFSLGLARIRTAFDDFFLFASVVCRFTLVQQLPCASC